ncbi:MAG: TatD DNase family protein [Candidatus Hydrogenedentes bacterium]|nr:TatD DNase family protein [Candidatus Hydrogenedentota bacterium]
MTALADTHCHLQLDAFDTDREAVLERALDTLAWIVVIGDDVPSSRAAVAMARDRVYATVGLHPHKAREMTPEALDELRALAQRDGVVAFGEIGLDYHYEFSPREQQKTALRAQLELAAELELPVVVHCREAQEDMTSMLDDVHRQLAGGVMLCFSGDAPFLRSCLDWGFYISFAGNVTFKKAVDLREVARGVPMDRLLIETDSPYLAPQPVRGKRCEPIHVEYTAQTLAEVRGMDFDHLAQQTPENAQRFFRV